MSRRVTIFASFIAPHRTTTVLRDTDDTPPDGHYRPSSYQDPSLGWRAAAHYLFDSDTLQHASQYQPLLRSAYQPLVYSAHQPLLCSALLYLALDSLYTYTTQSHFQKARFSLWTTQSHSRLNSGRIIPAHFTLPFPSSALSDARTDRQTTFIHPSTIIYIRLDASATSAAAMAPHHFRSVGHSFLDDENAMRRSAE